jgi:hypothetical protein
MPKPRPTRDEAMGKWLTTTEALTSDERRLIRELREVGPDTARRSVEAIEAAKRRRKES